MEAQEGKEMRNKKVRSNIRQS